MRAIVAAFLLTLLIACSKNAITHSSYILLTDTNKIKVDLDSIINTKHYRNYQNIDDLNQVANFIKKEFTKASDSVSEQTFSVGNNVYRNIICSLNTDKSERIIIGAHYDVYGDQDGADDNASGVAGLLELARLLKNTKLDYRIDLVAYSLEEPPFFKTENMGSYVHAKYLYDNKIPVKGMICLEMIGYFNDAEDSQDYPVGILSWFYGNKGDYITIVQKYYNGDFANNFNSAMKEADLLKTKTFKSFSWVTGVDFSDHLNYWKFDFSAAMVTNTSFYRNHNYHEKTDKVETLDLRRMALTIDEIYLAVQKIKP